MVIKKDIRLRGSKGEVNVSALFDSGSTYSCIESTLAHKIERSTPLCEPLVFETAEKGGRLIANQAIRCNFYLNGYRFSDEFMLIEGLSEDVIIGAKTLQAWRLKLDFEHDEVIVDPRVTKLYLKKCKKGAYLLEDPKSLFDKAERYFKNAKETLLKSEIEYDRYKDEKYVKEASAMGYLSALAAIDGYLLSIGIGKDKLPTSITEYEKSLRKIPHNGKLMSALKTVYENLHIFGYYRGGLSVGMIKEGFTKAKFIIDTLSKGNYK